jgi:formate dehydrogenase gamma subunit
MVQVSFIALVVTGFALKYPESWWARPFLGWEAQVPLRGWVHRIAAILMMVGLLYHVLHVSLRRRDRPFIAAMVPRWKDVQDLVQMVRYNLGWTTTRPAFGAFSYGEKAEYLAFLWGTVVMGVTGFLLWFENVTLRYFPLWVADAATVLHWYEAILATLAIVVWHFYAVIFDPDVYPMDRAWITGRASAEHLAHTRPEYYRQIVTRLGSSPSDGAAPASTSADSASTRDGDSTPPPAGKA